MQHLNQYFKEYQHDLQNYIKEKHFTLVYKGEGIDEIEFQEADKNLHDLVTEYEDKQDLIVHVDAEFKCILTCMWLYLCFFVFVFCIFFWLLFCCVMLSILRKTFCKSCKK